MCNCGDLRSTQLDTVSEESWRKHYFLIVIEHNCCRTELCQTNYFCFCCFFFFVAHLHVNPFMLAYMCLFCKFLSAWETYKQIDRKTECLELRGSALDYLLCLCVADVFCFGYQQQILYLPELHFSTLFSLADGLDVHVLFHTLKKKKKKETYQDLFIDFQHWLILSVSVLLFSQQRSWELGCSELAPVTITICWSLISLSL